MSSLCSGSQTTDRTPQNIKASSWQVAGSDLFELDGKHYLLLVDYFSRFPEVIKLNTTTSSAVIRALQAAFSRYGIPEVLRSDNGPQYASQEFVEFAREYSFQHITSSPRYPQSNGQAEHMVQTVEQLLKQATDPYLALLNYRATPLPWCNLSPTELSMGRRVRTLVDEILVPQWPYIQQFRRQNEHQKNLQKKYFDLRHRVIDLPDIPDDTEVWIATEGGPVEGKVASPADIILWKHRPVKLKGIADIFM